MTSRIISYIFFVVTLMTAAASGGWFDNYQTYDAYNLKLDEIAANYPQLATTFTAGTSLEGRPIRGIRIAGTGTGTVARKSVFLNGIQHAREWVAGMVPMYIADRLTNEYGSDPRVTNALDNAEFIIVPMVNPDGYEYSRTSNRQWRKNRRPNADGSFGVDLNRNFGVGWGLDSGSSSVPNSPTYRGPAPFSEPESQTIRDTFLANQQIVSHVDFHSYGQIMLSPWGYSLDPVPDQAILDQLTATMAGSIQSVHGEMYEHGDAFLYLSSGTARDWTYGDQAAYSTTIELRPTSSNPGFELPPSEIIPTAEELFPAALDLAEFTAALAGGDFNWDGAYDCTDVDQLVNAIVFGTNRAEMDVTGDGLVDSNDLHDWLARAGAAQLASGASYLGGDANLDGTVDGNDFLAWNEHKFTANASWCSGDFNADGTVDGVDFLVWNENKFQSAAAAVPEPSWSLMLFAMLLTTSGARRPGTTAL